MMPNFRRLDTVYSQNTMISIEYHLLLYISGKLSTYLFLYMVYLYSSIGNSAVHFKYFSDKSHIVIESKSSMDFFFKSLEILGRK